MAINPRSDLTLSGFTRGDPPVTEEGLVSFLVQEIERLQQVVSELIEAAPQVADVAPSNPRKGMIRYAVAPWDPLGDGSTGYVVFNGTTWQAL